MISNGTASRSTTVILGLRCPLSIALTYPKARGIVEGTAAYRRSSLGTCQSAPGQKRNIERIATSKRDPDPTFAVSRCDLRAKKNFLNLFTTEASDGSLDTRVLRRPEKSEPGKEHAFRRFREEADVLRRMSAPRAGAACSLERASPKR